MKRGPDLQPRRFWTEADNQQLRELMAAGLSRRDVAASLGRSENAVRMQCRKLGLVFCRLRARARIAAAMADVWQSLEYRAKVGEAVAATWTDERRAKQSQMSRERQLWKHGHAALAPDTEARARQKAAASAAMRAMRSQALAWCPMEYRDDYRFLQKSGGYRAAEARVIIEAQIATDLELYAKTGRLPQSRRSQSSPNVAQSMTPRD